MGEEKSSDQTNIPIHDPHMNQYVEMEELENVNNAAAAWLLENVYFIFFSEFYHFL